MMISITSFPHRLGRAARWLALGVLLAAVQTPALAQQVYRLYPGAAPGSEKWTITEKVRPAPGGGNIYSDVRDPTLTAYLPDPSAANGSAVILLPGGGLRILVIGSEADDTIRRLTHQGMAVFVLKYRVLQESAAPAAAPSPAVPHVVIRNGNANPAPDDPVLGEVLNFAVEDAKTALGMVRAHAAQWHLDPARIGMLGSSAGGGVAIGAELRKGSGAGPAFLGTLYGPSLMDVTVPADAPPLFIATEADHGPVTEGLLALFPLWKAAGRPAELHVFQTPRLETRLWLDRFVEWLREQHILQPGRSDHSAR